MGDIANSLWNQLGNFYQALLVLSIVFGAITGLVRGLNDGVALQNGWRCLVSLSFRGMILGVIGAILTWMLLVGALQENKQGACTGILFAMISAWFFCGYSSRITIVRLTQRSDHVDLSPASRTPG